MSMIFCDCECTHQKEGYCMLEKPDVVRNHNENDGCPHYINCGKDEEN